MLSKKSISTKDYKTCEHKGKQGPYLGQKKNSEKEINVDLAKKALEDIITEKKKKITPQLIIEVVTEHFNISMDQMISRSRSSEIGENGQKCYCNYIANRAYVF